MHIGRVFPRSLQRALHLQLTTDNFVLLFVDLHLARADLVHELEELTVLELGVRVLAHGACHLARSLLHLQVLSGFLRHLLEQGIHLLRNRWRSMHHRLVVHHGHRGLGLLPRHLMMRLARGLPGVVQVVGRKSSTHASCCMARGCIICGPIMGGGGGPCMC